MKFNTIVIGGGLAGYTCAIKLAEEGQHVLLVSAGESSLHFSSGSFDLLGYDEDGQVVSSPTEAVQQLPLSHPYRKVKDFPAKAEDAKRLLNQAGLAFKGDVSANHFRLTPVGMLMPTWLSLDGMVVFPTTDSKPWESAAIVCPIGFLDFPTAFVQDSLSAMGIRTRTLTITTAELEYARESTSEMRATNLARRLERGKGIEAVAQAINALDIKESVILMPAIFGYDDPGAANKLQKLVHKPVVFSSTIPPSVPGVLMQKALKQRLRNLGGMILDNNTVLRGTITDCLENIVTDKIEDPMLAADHFVLATGTFLSGGLTSNYTHVSEPIFGLDVDADTNRQAWHVEDFYEKQPYMRFGVHTDDTFHTSKDGKTIPNLYAIGSVLSGKDSVRAADREGVDMLTALQTAQNILDVS